MENKLYMDGFYELTAEENMEIDGGSFTAILGGIAAGLGAVAAVGAIYTCIYNYGYARGQAAGYANR